MCYSISNQQEGHRQAVFWGGGVSFQLTSTSTTKQEPTIDLKRFTMIFQYLSPWGFGEHAAVIAKREFRVSQLLFNLEKKIFGCNMGVVGGNGGMYFL